METTGKKVNVVSWFVHYIRESKEELMKVTWPSRSDVTKYSVVIIVLSLIIAGFFAGFDLLLNNGLAWLIKIVK